MFKKFTLASLFFSLSSLLFAQQGMEVHVNNFSSFPGPVSSLNSELEAGTPSALKSHPEYGLLPENSPCTDCYEVLEKRTPNSRYFVRNGTNGSAILTQTGYSDLHYYKDGFLQSIDHKLRPKEGAPGVYHAPDQYVATEVNVTSKFTRIDNKDALLSFNRNLKLYRVEPNGQKILLSTASWANASAGRDGLRVTDIFPSIDLEVETRIYGLKSTFIIKNQSALSSVPSTNDLLIVDETILPTGYSYDLSYTTQAADGGHIGEIYLNGQGDNGFVFSPAVAYDASGNKSRIEYLPYHINGAELGIAVPAGWLKDTSLIFPLIIDPLVSGTNTLAQASITGSRYNATCNFVNGCAYNLTVAVPAAITITDVRFSFSYSASGACWLQDGAMDFTYGACRSPGTAGFYWFCNSTGGGTCNGANISMFSDISACIPAPQCASYNMPFTMNFYRSCWGNTGGACSPNCIAAASGWTTIVEGRTVEQPAAPTSSFGTTICSGAATTLTASPGFGVPPYTYSWSNGAVTQSTSVAPTSNTSYTCVITDACGNTASNSIAITINNSMLTPAPAFSIAMNPATGNPCPVTITVTDQTSTNYGGGQENYQWSFPGATTVSPATTSGSSAGPPYTSSGTGIYTLTYATGGTFTLAMQILKSGQCNSASQSFSICTLPIELLDFSASRKDNIVRLAWSTASEFNNEKFILERSPDATNFTEIGTVKGGGTVNTVSNYSFDDTTPPGSKTYYRLKQVDFDGNYSFSEIVAVNSKEGRTLTFFPNPVSEHGVVAFNLPNSQDVTIRMYNYTGQLVLERVISGNTGTNEIPLSLEGLPAGIYSLKLSEISGLRSTVIVKK